MGTADLGAFRLHDRLAQGGMGEVWSAVHRPSGLQCAIKLIRPDLMNDQAAQDFDREVRSQARLDHPGIVYLLDHGRLDAAASTHVDLPPGLPWVAMEYCSSSLYQISGGLSWEGLRRVLLQLLDALSHAHAAGVLHRDIKVSNVLVSTAQDLRPGVKLADFGVAHVLTDADETTRNVGTPRYMPPEQVNGEWEMLGPWTDLYALGVLAWRVATGKRPWSRRRGHLLVVAMLEEPLGWPGARFEVPPDFSRWIERMTHKAPSARFQLAADAAAALRTMPGTHQKGGAWLPSQFLDGGVAAATLVPQLDEDEVLMPRSALVFPMEEPPVETEASIRLHAAGLGLLALRRPALIGRKTERRLAWGLWRSVAQTGRARVLCVQGAPGVGRSRFIAWVGETVERTGQGLTVGLALVPGREVGDQIVRALRAWFRIGAMDRLAASTHLETWLGPGAFLDDLAALLVRAEASDSAWQGLVRAGLVALGRRRPVVLRIEGAERHPELEGFLRGLLEMDHAAVLVVMDAELPGGEVLDLQPLSGASMNRLANAMVPLDPELRAQLVAQASGSPGYLATTLTHWALQERLIPGTKGYTLEGEQGGAPTLSVVAASRLGAVNRDLSEGSSAALERAAVLGMSVDPELWSEVDGRDRAHHRGRVVECLVQRGLMVEEEGRLRFTSVPFREAVLQQAAPRLSAHHRRCADALARRKSAVAVLARGRHLLAAGALEASLDPLREGVERVGLREGAQAGLASLAQLDRAVQELLGPQRLRWKAVADGLQAGFLIELGQESLATEAIESSLRTGVLLSDLGLQARAWACRGAAASRRGESPVAIRAYRQALDLGDTIPSAEQGRWWVELGKCHLARGDRTTWSVCMTAAAECAAADIAWSNGRGGSPQLVPLGHAAAAQVAGRFEAALACLDEAYALAAEMGSGLARLSVLRSRAHTLLDAGRLEEARTVFAKSLELALQVRASRAGTVLANAVALEFRLGQRARAVDLFDQHRYLLPPGGEDAELVPLHCAGMAVAASRQQWDQVEQHRLRIEAHGPWGWGVLACNLVAVRVAVEIAKAHGRRVLARELVALGLERAAEAGRTHPDRQALDRAMLGP